MAYLVWAAQAAAISSLVGFFLYTVYSRCLPKPIAGVPYNKAATKSLLGDFPSFQKWHKERPELYTWVASQCAALESPIIQLFMRPFSKPWVVVSDFEAANDIMTRRTNEFGRAEVVGDFFAPLLPNWHTHMPMGDEWRAHRRLIGDTMSLKFLRQAAGPRIYQHTHSLLRLWSKKASMANGRPFTASEDVHRAGFDIIWAVAFGDESGAIAAQRNALSGSIQPDHAVDTPVSFGTAGETNVFDTIIALTRSVETAISSPFPRMHLTLALKLVPSLRSAMRKKNSLIKARLDAAWQKFNEQSAREDDVSSATDLFVQREVAMAKKEGRPPVYDTPVIRDELFGFLIAGYDTSSVTMCWGLKFLTAHQEVQQNLRAALSAGVQMAIAAGRCPSVDEITESNVPYLDATIEEIHRLGGTVSSNVRQALCDTQILGCHIPKGTDVFLLNSGPSYVTPAIPHSTLGGKQPNGGQVKYGQWDPASISDFVPERWLVRDSTGTQQFNPQAGPSHPFGAGARGCFGRKLASLELKIMLILIIWKFQLLPTPAELSSFVGHDVNTHTPQQCYLTLLEIA